MSGFLNCLLYANTPAGHLFQHLLPPTLQELQEHDDEDEILAADDEEPDNRDEQVPAPKPVFQAAPAAGKRRAPPKTKAAKDGSTRSGTKAPPKGKQAKGAKGAKAATKANTVTTTPEPAAAGPSRKTKPAVKQVCHV